MKRPPSSWPRARKSEWPSVFLFASTCFLASAVARAQTPLQPVRPAADETHAIVRACSRIGGPVVEATVDVTRAEVDAAYVLPNPALGFNLNRSLTGPRDYEAIVGLGVSLGIGGSWFVLQEAAETELHAQRLSAGQTSFYLALRMRARYARAAIASSRRAIYDELSERIQGLIDRLERLKPGGESSPAEIVRLKARRATLALSARPFRAELAAHRSWLSAMVGSPVRVDATSATRLNRSVAKAQRPTKAPHPLVASLLVRRDADALRAKAAERRWAPDISLFAGYRTVGGVGAVTGHGLSLGVSVPLTFFDHGQGEARRARAAASLSEARATIARRRLEAARSEAEARREGLDSADPGTNAAALASRWLEAAERLYLAGEGSILDVLEAYQAVAAARLAELDLEAQRTEASIAWMKAAGRLGERRLDDACALTVGAATGDKQ